MSPIYYCSSARDDTKGFIIFFIYYEKAISDHKIAHLVLPVSHRIQQETFCVMLYKSYMWNKKKR